MPRNEVQLVSVLYLMADFFPIYFMSDGVTQMADEAHVRAIMKPPRGPCTPKVESLSSSPARSITRHQGGVFLALARYGRL